MTTTEQPLPQPIWAMATVQIPVSPLIEFDRIRKTIRDEFTQLLGEIDAYLTTLGITNTPPPRPVIRAAAPKRRRWLR